MQDRFFPLQFAGDPPIISALCKWRKIVVLGAAKSGRAWTNLQHYKLWMEDIRLADVVEMKLTSTLRLDLGRRENITS